MCARRNPDAHARLIGPMSQCDHEIPKWRGNYPQGLSGVGFGKAQGIRADVWAQGLRVADIVDAFEELQKDPKAWKNHAQQACNTIAARAISGKQAEANLKELLVRHWTDLKWKPPLIYYAHSVPLGQFGEVDIIAFDTKNGRIAYIELQLDREEKEVFDDLQYYLSLLRPHVPEGVGLQGIVVANQVSPDLRKAAKESEIQVYVREVLATYRPTSSEEPRIRIKVKRHI